MMDLSKFENAAEVNAYVEQLEAEIVKLKRLLSDATCNCGPYTEIDPVKHDSIRCTYRARMEG